MNNSSSNILIIRLSSIGDILLATPFIRQTRIAFPRSQIDFIIKKEFSELLEYNNNINTLLQIDTQAGKQGLKVFKNKLLEQRYDYIFDLHNNLRSNYLCWGLQGRNKYKINKNKLTQLLYVKLKINQYSQIVPIAERYLNVGKTAGIPDDGKGLEIFWNKKTEDFVKNVLNKNRIEEQETIIAIAPGAGFYTKRWLLEYYKILIENILKHQQCKIVILGNENDKQQGKILAEGKNIIDLTGHLSLLQSAVVLSKSKALISNDTGLMHMATAVKTPVLAIFGSTVKEFGFFPYRSKSIVVENVGLKCRPCSHIGRHDCPKDHFKCMREITPDIVMEKFGELLND